MDERRYFEIVASYKLMAKHEVGQNFLIDTDAAQRIVAEADIQKGEKVLEIGSGAGSLTYFLSKTEGDIEAIDIDEGLIAKLQEDFAGDVNVHYGNAAKFEYAPYDKIIGNLPYYITSSLVERTLLLGVNAKKMVFMVQKEAGERLLSLPGGKDYGPLPVLLRWLSNPKRAFSVKRDCFAPAPHVDSIVLRFDMLSRPDIDLKKAYRFVEAMFLQRRKKLLNNLKNALHDSQKAEHILHECGLSPDIRPEQVSPEVFLRLYRLTFEIK
ncbi:MAG: ribosomal RNA small subunit methyltransferase A [Bacilli bacterium]|nr:ribosomal RNA small subunit methyltransferase A [Bacilli bacterium]